MIYVGFSRETLERCPELHAGEGIDCPACGERHEVQIAEDDPRLLVYSCRGKVWIGGAHGRCVVGVRADVTGRPVRSRSR